MQSFWLHKVNFWWFLERKIRVCCEAQLTLVVQ